MEDLIRALQIFIKYGNPDYPTCCEHDILTICGIEPEIVSANDKIKLKELGFIVSDEWGEEAFVSFKYGSA
jgi:hypothetical protein